MSPTGRGPGILQWMAIIVVVSMMVGCSTPSPRYVEGVDSSEDRVKFLYKYEHSPGEWERGIYECEVDDGRLENCRSLEVEYR